MEKNDSIERIIKNSFDDDINNMRSPLMQNSEYLSNSNLNKIDETTSAKRDI